jgi:hypothetical protein
VYGLDIYESKIMETAFVDTFLTQTIVMDMILCATCHRIRNLTYSLTQPQEAEIRGFKEAITWFGNRGLPDMRIELDCKPVVEGISNNIGTE